ncbi:hypothetical protein BP6252_06724 [Coleophoma cylindrospora]|uniref:Uncharacterized protein n=1 Tax=Coleophoma cylindrospora TaxID=1849047 RepID=A0A3D8RFJ5_9HELO|nr:hypothetical protein BP6252_06724 [Coleophoma cylindrospora]
MGGGARDCPSSEYNSLLSAEESTIWPVANSGASLDESADGELPCPRTTRQLVAAVGPHRDGGLYVHDPQASSHGVAATKAPRTCRYKDGCEGQQAQRLGRNGIPRQAQPQSSAVLLTDPSERDRKASRAGCPNLSSAVMGCICRFAVSVRASVGNIKRQYNRDACKPSSSSAANGPPSCSGVVPGRELSLGQGHGWQRGMSALTRLASALMGYTIRASTTTALPTCGKSVVAIKEQQLKHLIKTAKSLRSFDSKSVHPPLRARTCRRDEFAAAGNTQRSVSARCRSLHHERTRGRTNAAMAGLATGKGDDISSGVQSLLAGDATSPNWSEDKPISVPLTWP